MGKKSASTTNKNKAANEFKANDPKQNKIIKITQNEKKNIFC